MKAFKEIQKELGLNDHQARIRFGFLDSTAWKNFRDTTRSVNVRKMLEVFAASNDDCITFLNRLAEECDVDLSAKQKECSKHKRKRK